MLATITGFGQAVVRFFSIFNNRNELPNYFATIFFSTGLVTLLITAVSSSILGLVGSYISYELLPLLWAALALFVASAWYATLMDVLRSQEKSSWYTFISICQSFSGIIFGLILVLEFGMGITGLVWGQTLGLLWPIIPLIWLTTKSATIHRMNIKGSDIRQLWKFAWPFTFGNIAFWSLSLADRYIVNMFRGSYEVGLYTVANKISWRTIQLLVYLFFLVPAPIISRLWEERGRKAAEEALTAFTRVFFMTIIPAVCGLSVVAAPLIKLITEEAYFDSYQAIWLVACASMGLGLTNLGCTGCLVSKRTYLIARNQCVMAGIGLGLNFLLVPKLGYIGAALTAVVSYSILAGIQAYTSSHYMTWRWPIKSLIKVILASSLMAGAVLVVEAAMPEDTMVWRVVSLSLSILSGALVYGLALWILREISPRSLSNLFRSDRNLIEPEASLVDPIQTSSARELYK